MRFWTRCCIRLCIPLALLVFVGPAMAQADPLAGQWKVTLFRENQPLPFWLLTIDAKDGKYGADAQTLSNIPETTVSRITRKGDLVHMTFALSNGVVFQYEGLLAPGGKKILGSLSRGGGASPCSMEATDAKSPFELDREFLKKSPADPKVFSTLLSLIPQAKSNKAPARDVQDWVEGVLGAAASYGPRWHGEYGIRVLDTLSADFPAVALETGTRLERSLETAAGASSEMKYQLLTAMENAASAAGKDAEAAKLAARLSALQPEVLKEVAPAFKIIPYSGKVGRPVLVELFTGAQCPPCVGADIGFDALEKAFPGNDAVLLQYHLHIPDSDALGNADADARAEYYAHALKGTPGIFFGGTTFMSGGGGREDGEEKYKEYREATEKLVVLPSGGKIALAARRKGDVVTIETSASLTEAVKGPVRLRLALVEDLAYYRGRNGQSFHHHVVRAMPGGAKGFDVDKSIEKTLTVDLGTLREKLKAYLDDYAKENPFPDAQRPMRLRDLHVAAFLQDDTTHAVLQAVRVPVK